MSRLVRSFVAGADEVDDLLRPRDDIVLERPAGTTGAGHRFELAHGPFTSYSRLVEVSLASPPQSAGQRHPQDGTAARHRVTETVEWRLAVPWFGPALNPAIRRAMRKGRTGDGTQPVWAPPQRFTPRAATVMAALAAAAMLSGYLANAPSELHTYAADEFGADQAAQGVLGAVVRIGTLLAVGVSVLADRHGRRRIAAGTMGVGVAAAALAALAPDMVWLGVFLLIGRTANTALSATIVVMALEEIPAGARAWCLSVLAMSAALGAGGVVWLAPISDLAPWAWRIVFALPLAALAAARPLLRRLPESRRFDQRGREARMRQYWRPIALLGAIYLAFGLFLGPIDWFRNEYLRDEHGFSAALVSLFVLSTATPAGIALYAAGRLAESRGRRIVLTVAAVLGLGALVAMFNLSGPALWVAGLAGAMLSAGLLPALGVYRGELFPTAVRARAATLTGALGVGGAAVGIVVAGRLRTMWGSFGEVIALAWAGPLLATAIAVLWLTERGGQELDQLHPADAAASHATPWSSHA
ncbi:hypothetical protein [Candidatus Poriferisodalis sp.]|uniref:hypothetical protein n=1 Tax=Candidatus Poriferisodalis sp. TaxID=3101277 RepID=UPI003B025171